MTIEPPAFGLSSSLLRARWFYFEGHWWIAASPDKSPLAYCYILICDTTSKQSAEAVSVMKDLLRINETDDISWICDVITDSSSLLPNRVQSMQGNYEISTWICHDSAERDKGITKQRENSLFPNDARIIKLKWEAQYMTTKVWRLLECCSNRGKEKGEALEMKDILTRRWKGDYPQLFLSAHLSCPDLLLNQLIHSAVSSVHTYTKSSSVACSITGRYCPKEADWRSAFTARSIKQ